MAYSYIKILLCFLSFLFSQSRLIQGVVLNQSKEKISNVNIVSYPSKSGAQSDSTGRFTFTVLSSDKEIVLDHIGYLIQRIDLDTFQNGTLIILNKKILNMDSLNVTADMRNLFNVFEGNNNIISLKVSELSQRGFTDLGDAMFLEQSVLINETVNGQKHISIRASNSDELMLLIDGVRINRMSDPLIDLGMFSENSLSGLELVKGPHEKGLSSSGTINLIPKLTYQNSFLFNQKFGTYNYGDYHILGSLGHKKIAINSGFGQRRSSQIYSKESFPEIHNYQDNIFVNMGFRSSENFEYKFLGSNVNKTFINNRMQDSLSNHNQNAIIKIIYSNKTPLKMVLYGLHQTTTGFEENDLILKEKNEKNSSLGFELEKHLKNATFRLINETSFPEVKWVINDLPIGLDREVYNFTGSFEINHRKRKKDIYLKDIKFLFSKNFVNDRYDSSPVFNFQSGSWNFTNSLLTASIINDQADKQSFLYANIGNAFRIPSISEFILNQTQDLIPEGGIIHPEKKTTFELGYKLDHLNPKTNNSSSMTLSYFRYQYIDKIIQIQYSGSPFKYPINIGNASLSGFDSRLNFKPKLKWISYTSNFSYYFFSDPLAFQLQPDKMIRNIITIKSKWINLNLIHRSESSRQITTVSNTGTLSTNFLDPIANFDITIASNLTVRAVRLSTTFSVRNINNMTQELEGISLYDQRYLLKFMVSI